LAQSNHPAELKEVNYGTCETNGRYLTIVKPKQPYITWANSLEDGGVKLGEEYMPEHTIYLVEDTTGYMLNTKEIVEPL
jgi:hypothetical protein